MSSPNSSTDTIAAIATPRGTGGLSVIRISGRLALEITERITTYPESFEPHRATYTHLRDPDLSEEIDEVVVTYFRSPKSYTGEDVVEISCHGGYYVTQRILRIILDQGARMADPGEFTRRAFLNGRIDLTQAEAVADLIAAQTSSSHKLAYQQIEGELKERIQKIRQRLIDTVSILELELDFAEEEISKTPYPKVREYIEGIKEECRQLVESYSEGKLYKDGILATIVGRPNAGKSSILNALLREERALVSDVPGTTRDTIEEVISHKGVAIRLVDTAGLRQSSEKVESMGISKAEEFISKADVILHVIDVANEEERGSAFNPNGKPVITLYNKIDLISDGHPAGKTGNNSTLYTSATEMEGISEIGDTIIGVALGESNGTETGESVTITNERHKDALLSTIESLDRALESTNRKMSSEFIVVDLRSALDSLGLLSGETTTDDILDNIFSRFCIGK